MAILSGDSGETSSWSCARRYLVRTGLVTSPNEFVTCSLAVSSSEPDVSTFGPASEGLTPYGHSPSIHWSRKRIGRCNESKRLGSSVVSVVEAK